MKHRRQALCVLFALIASVAVVSRAAWAAPPAKSAAAAAAPPAGRATPVGFPQDAGPHDATAAIEWWYFNTFLTTTTGGHHYAVVGAFFRTGLPSGKKGHYLIYSLIDLDNKSQSAYSVLDKADADLLKSYLPLVIAQHPDDPRPYRILSQLQTNDLPPPHRILGQAARVRTDPLFSIVMENATLSEETADGRIWKASLAGDDWTLDLTLTQPVGRAMMLVGGKGTTGLTRPDDMYYMSLTHMDATAVLTQGGVIDKLTGTGWLDRQWGTSWIVQDNGWDWFGLRLSDGSDLVVYRVRDHKTGKILRAEATLLNKDGTQYVDSAPTFALDTTAPAPTAAAPSAAGADGGGAAPPAVGPLWTDPDSEITYPQAWSIKMPRLGLSLTLRSVFPEQVVPVIGIGEAIWEGAVTVTGTGNNGAALTGQGFMELVGYRKPPAAKGAAASGN